MKLRALHRFTSTATAVEEITAIQEGKMGRGLRKFLSKEIVEKGKGDKSLLVVDSKLGTPLYPPPKKKTRELFGMETECRFS